MFRPLAIAAAALLSLGSAAAVEQYQLDDVHSVALFKVSHLGVSSTWGRFNAVAGTITWDASDAAKALTITVQTDSVDTHNEKRDQHLKQADFLNAKQFPVATFASKAWKATGPSTWDVTGDFTLHGVTRTVTVPATLVGKADTPFKDHRLGLDATLSFKRSDFGMTDKLAFAGDQITLVVAVEGIRQ